MQEIKASHEMHHPKYYKVILKIMLLPHATLPPHKLPSHTYAEINIFNIHSMDCVVDSKSHRNHKDGIRVIVVQLYHRSARVSFIFPS